MSPNVTVYIVFSDIKIRNILYTHINEGTVRFVNKLLFLYYFILDHKICKESFKIFFQNFFQKVENGHFKMSKIEIPKKVLEKHEKSSCW